MSFFSPLLSETEQRLRHYEGLLHKWQDKINLISPNTLKESWERHFLDSLQILPLIPSSAKTLYDIGSGAGFPGMVIAIARPDLEITLIESDSKKCAFLQTISRETNTKITIVNDRVERAVGMLSPPDVITARALASLKELFELCSPWLKTSPNIQAIFPKGAQYGGEIEAAKQAGWAFHVEQIDSKTDNMGKILRLSNIHKIET